MPPRAANVTTWFCKKRMYRYKSTPPQSAGGRRRPLPVFVSRSEALCPVSRHVWPGKSMSDFTCQCTDTMPALCSNVFSMRCGGGEKHREMQYKLQTANCKLQSAKCKLHTHRSCSSSFAFSPAAAVRNSLYKQHTAAHAETDCRLPNLGTVI